MATVRIPAGVRDSHPNGTTASAEGAVVGAGPSRELRGHLARPAGDGPWPGVVVLHEAFGLDATMRRMTDRLAAAGYLSLAPNLYSGGVRCLVSTMRSAATGRGQAFTDIDAARRWLAAEPDCTGRVGVIGFCMGGGFALIAAAHGFAAAAPNYPVTRADIDEAVRGSCPVVASFGGRDRMLRGAATRLDAALTNAGVPHDVKEYPQAGHSFLNDAPAGPRVLWPLLRVSGIRPEPTAAEDAWRRIETFFAHHLAAPDAPDASDAPDAPDA